MNRTPLQPLTEDEIHALADHQVLPIDQSDLQTRLAQDPQAQANLLKWQLQRDALRGLYQEVLHEPSPTTLVTRANQTAAAQQNIDQWWRWGGRAAGVMLAFGVGWFANTAWQGMEGAQRPLASLSKTGGAPDFVRQAGFAHGVYTPEVRHPVEVTAAEQEHLIQWLSKRVGKPLKIPNLASQGYELVGGRLLPGDTGARAQFMFQNAAGIRVTLYLGAITKTSDGNAPPETAFQFAAVGEVPSFYWVDQGFGYALTGQIPREALMQLAQAVYRQL